MTFSSVTGRVKFGQVGRLVLSVREDKAVEDFKGTEVPLIVIIKRLYPNGFLDDVVDILLCLLLII